jgi:hypothetical protein
MTRTSASPRLVTLVLSILALLAALLPANAAAAPEGGEAPLTITPGSPLPKTTVGFQSYEDFTVSSTAGALEFNGVWTSGSDFWIDWGSSNCGGSSETCSLRVYFSPSSAGTKLGALNLMVGGYEDWVAPISGDAVEPQLTLEPSNIDFGTQWVHRGEERLLEVRNSGEARLQLSGIDVNGPDRDHFWSGGGACWSLPDGWLDPGESCAASVYFQPDDVRDYEATLKVSVNGHSVSAPLSGAGGRAVVEPESNPVDFGAVTAGVAGELQTIELVNHGNLPGSFFIAVIAGGDARSFELVEESCSGFTPVGPGESCRARIRFTPQSSGPKQARLALFGEDDGGTMIVLEGEGVAPALTLAPAGFEFGAMAAGTGGVAHPFAVRNDGSTPVALGGVGIVGTDPDQFRIAGDGCTGATLAPGAECAVRVRFAPDRAGARAATLRIAAPGGPLTASLRGTGTAAPVASLNVASAGAAMPRPGRGAGKSGRRHLFRQNSSIHNRGVAKRMRRNAKKRAAQKRAPKQRAIAARGRLRRG